MAVNLLAYLSDQFSTTVVNEISRTLDETYDNTLKTTAGAIPAVLGGLAHYVSESGSASSLLSFLRGGDYSQAPFEVGQVTGTGQDLQSAVGVGDQFISKILGSKSKDVASELARYGGVKIQSAQAIMALIGAELRGVLGRQVLENGLSTDNLHSLFAGQAVNFRKALPVGLSGVASLLNFDAFEASSDPEKVQLVDNFSGSAVNPDIPKSPQIERERENNRWLRPALLAVGALVVFLLVQKCREPQTSTDGIETDTTARVESDAQEDTSAATRSNIEKTNASTKDTAAGEFKRNGAIGNTPGSNKDATRDSATTSSAQPEVRTQIELPGGRRLKLTENSFTYNLAKFLGSKPANPLRTFTFDNLTFETNSSRITSSSQPNVNDLIEIMKAYPSLNIRIEGSTDNTGDARTNKNLSLERALAVKYALTTAGIEANRVTTQGFGSEKPTASNDTPEGKRKNRRIDVVVTKL